MTAPARAVAFYGRVSTEDAEDPSSRCRATAASGICSRNGRPFDAVIVEWIDRFSRAHC
jgi:hypothetical protein